jgi:hypothetical protein
MAVVALMGPGIIVQTGNRAASDRWKKLVELPVVGGPARFDDTWWSHVSYADRTAARRDHPEFIDDGGNDIVRPTGGLDANRTNR